MSWKSEFESQWQTFLDTVETNVRNEIKINGQLDAASANAIVQSEVAKWSNSSHYNGAWLRKLAREYPSLGEEFQETISELGLSKRSFYKPESPTLPVSGMGGIMLVTFFFLGWLRESNLRQIIGTAVVAIVMFPIFVNFWSEKKRKAINNFVEEIKKELKSTEKKLIKIALIADVT